MFARKLLRLLIWNVGLSLTLTGGFVSQALASTPPPVSGTVIVRCLDNVGNEIRGSGVVIPRRAAAVIPAKKASAVVTAAHVVADCVPESTVVIVGTTEYSGQVVKQDPLRDVALLRVAGRIKPSSLSIGVVVPVAGATVAIRGAAAPGPVTQHGGTIRAATPNSLEVTGGASDGQSGGGVFDSVNRLLGIIVAGDDTKLYAVPLPEMCGLALSVTRCGSTPWR